MRKLALAAFVAAFTMGVLYAGDDELANGLVGDYYRLGNTPSDFPKLTPEKEKKPDLRRVDKTVNFESTEEGFADTDYRDNLFVRWTGFIRIPKDGKYKFYAESDDGSRIFIGDKLVVDNGGLHGMEEKEGEIELKAGDHPIKIEFFEGGGGAGCKISWEYKGLAPEIIPEKVLFHKKGAEKPPEK